MPTSAKTKIHTNAQTSALPKRFSVLRKMWDPHYLSSEFPHFAASRRRQCALPVCINTAIILHDLKLGKEERLVKQRKWKPKNRVHLEVHKTRTTTVVRVLLKFPPRSLLSLLTKWASSIFLIGIILALNTHFVY